MMILLQDEGPLIDSRLWIYLIFAAVSVVGGLLTKKKKDQTEAAKRRQQDLRMPQARPRQPTPPRVPQPPRPARPARPAPPVEVRQPHAPAAPYPSARSQPPRAIPARSRPVVARPGPLPDRHATWRPALEHAEVLTAEVIQAAPADQQITALPSDALTPVATPERARRCATVEAEHVRRLVRCPTGLRAGFVLSEILAPPVGLRENRPV